MRPLDNDDFPPFTVDVPDGGYCWWYVDAISEDEAHAITLIGFIGSVFSPYYARARGSGAADPLEHCSLNCALYGRPGGWAMTERRSGSVERAAERLRIGPSSLQWTGSTLDIHVHERMMPLPRAMHGRVRVRPRVRTRRRFELDAAGRHQWWPVAPVADVEVTFTAPRLTWRGSGYFDFNRGSEPLAAACRSWHWSRLHAGSEAGIVYEASRCDGSEHCLALSIDAAGRVSEREPPPPRVTLPLTRWRVPRETRAEDARARLHRTLEDTPFYSRSLIHGRHGGRDLVGVHESLSMDRFTAPWVQLLLPFRMPRSPR